MLQTVGNVKVKIVNAYTSGVADFPAKEGEVDAYGNPVCVFGSVNIVVEDDQGNSGEIHYELSTRPSRGNDATNADRSMKTIEQLSKLTPAISSLNDLATYMYTNGQIESLIGLECVAVTEERHYNDKNTGEPKTFIRIKYLNANKTAVPMSQNTAAMFCQHYGIGALNNPQMQQQMALHPQSINSNSGFNTNNNGCPF